MSKPPIPSEHGAWMMLYAPLVIVMAGLGVQDIIPAAALVIAISAAFLGQHAAGLVFRGRSTPNIWGWLGGYTFLFLSSSSVLILKYGFFDLVWIGGLALVFLSRQVLKVWRARKRVDHSIFGEVAAVGAMALTGPAAYMLATSTIDRIAVGVWAACLLYFAGSVFYVKMRVSASACKSEISRSHRWKLGRSLVLYEGFLVLVLSAGTALVEGVAVVMIGFLPSVARALWGFVRLDYKPVSITRIGVGEIFYSLWFGITCVISLRTLAQ